MGWASGVHIFDAILESILNEEIDKKDIIKKLISILEDEDWDTQSESKYYDHPLVRECLKELHPNWFK